MISSLRSSHLQPGPAPLTIDSISDIFDPSRKATWMDRCTFDTELTADSFEACRAQEGVVAVGAYQYEPDGAGRKGRIYLMELDDTLSLVERDRVDTAGILDMRWQGSVLHASLSDGSLRRYRSAEGRLVAEAAVEVDPTAIALSLDIHGDQTVVSLNSGRAALVRADDTVELWDAHWAEVWCAALDRHDRNLAYTGSDDYTFCGWDLRCAGTKTFRSTQHMAGVCVVASDPHREHVIASGSYDETCCLWDTRSLKIPLGCVAARSGVWRLKWHPEKVGILLAGCMHDGFKIWATAQPDAIVELGCRPTVSIAYGCDWIAFGEHELCGGATFYNHEALVWSAGEPGQ